MGKLEDAASWLIFYVVRPAVQKVIDKFNASYRVFAEIAFVKAYSFLYWIATSNISIFTWVRNEIQDAIDDIEDNDWDFWGWIDNIVNAVFKSIKNIFVKVADLSSTVTNLIANWWKTTRTLFLSTLKNTFVAIADFTTDVTKIILDFGYETFDIIITTAGNMISKAVDVLADTVANIAKSVSTAIADIIETVSNAIASIEDSITDLTTDLLKDLAETESKIRKLLTDKIKEVMTYINEEVPKIIGGLFDWAKPIVNPIIAAAGWLGSIGEIITGTHKADPELEESIDIIKTKRDQVNEAIGRIP